VQIGIDSFAAAYDDASLAVSPSDRLRDLIEQIEHADRVGLDVFGVGASTTARSTSTPLLQ
jgi:nicotinic acid phosphoribosyltransferase